MPKVKCKSNGKTGVDVFHPTDLSKFEKRFWSKVDILCVYECWNWTAGTSNGRGMFAMPDGKSPARAYRVALALSLGKAVNDIGMVCHECDNPLCCNPNHLTEGDHAYNSRGMMDRGRGRGQFKKGVISPMLGKTRLVNSIKHGSVHRRTMQVSCDNCGESFFKRKDLIKDKSFCSRDCYHSKRWGYSNGYRKK